MSPNNSHDLGPSAILVAEGFFRSVLRTAIKRLRWLWRWTVRIMFALSCLAIMLVSIGWVWSYQIPLAGGSAYFVTSNVLIAGGSREGYLAFDVSKLLGSDYCYIPGSFRRITLSALGYDLLFNATGQRLGRGVILAQGNIGIRFRLVSYGRGIGLQGHGFNVNLHYGAVLPPPYTSERLMRIHVRVPYWFAFSSAWMWFVVAGWFLRRDCRQLRKAKDGFCVCGYDLRMHKSGEKCPECGTPHPGCLKPPTTA